MATIEILEVRTDQIDSDWLFKGMIEKPAVGFSDDIHSFSLAGWLLGTRQPVESVVITHQGVRVKVVPVNTLWPKISLRYPAQPGAQTPGFITEVGVTGFPSPCELVLHVQIKDGPLVPFGSIRLKHEPLQSNYDAKLQPLMITSHGRSGSTWSVRLFGEHPEIVIHRVHPYETMAANYWIHQLKVLTDPANHEQSMQRLGFADRPWNTGQNPYFTHPVIEHREMRRWFGRDMVVRTAQFCQQNIDEFYLNLARAQKDPKPRFFAEKNRADHIPRLMYGLYPGAREVFVLRDFRDMVCSMFAFNKMRGYVGVGPLDAVDEADFIRKLRPSIEQLLDSYDERKDRSILMKYEDLILQPEETLPGVLAYIGVKNDAKTVRRMLKAANSVPTKQRAKNVLSYLVPKRMQQRWPGLFTRLTPHKTSGNNPIKSINRWQTDLSPELQDVTHETLGDLLARAGYDIP